MTEPCYMISHTDTAVQSAYEQLNPTPEFLQYTQQLRPPADDEVLALEDKDTASCWRMNRLAYQIRTYHFFDQDSTHWQRMPACTLEDVAFEHEELYKHLREHGLMLRTTCRSFRDSIPTAYATVKAKCYHTHQHICKKPQHSCCRKIISWLKHPYRPLLRKISRAAQIMVDVTPNFGWGGQSLVRDAKARAERALPAV